jgi:hypothetical protein
MKLKCYLILAAIITFGGSMAYAHQSDPQQPFERPHAHDSPEFHIHTGWQSRYFSEGRDALDGDSIWASSFEFGLEHLAAGFWYGKSPDQSYDELQLSLALTQTFGDFETYIGYTHYIFPFDAAMTMKSARASHGPAYLRKSKSQPTSTTPSMLMAISPNYPSHVNSKSRKASTSSLRPSSESIKATFRTVTMEQTISPSKSATNTSSQNPSHSLHTPLTVGQLTKKPPRPAIRC